MCHHTISQESDSNIELVTAWQTLSQTLKESGVAVVRQRMKFDKALAKVPKDNRPAVVDKLGQALPNLKHPSVKCTDNLQTIFK